MAHELRKSTYILSPMAAYVLRPPENSSMPIFQTQLEDRARMRGCSDMLDVSPRDGLIPAGWPNLS